MNNGTSLEVKQRIRDELIIYAKVTWKHVVEQVMLNRFSAVAILMGFDKTWGAKKRFV